MEQRIGVLVGWNLASHHLRKIEDIDPRIRLLNVETPSLTPSSELFPPFPDELLPLLSETEILLTLRLPRDLLERAPELRWIHSQAAGVDYYLRSPALAASEIVVTTSSGVHAVPLGETVMGAILALAKGFPQAFRRQARGEWERYTPDEVQGATVGIIGAGHIGSAVAERSKAFGMRVVGIRRSVTDPREPEPPFDILLPPSDLNRLLGESDYVVVCAPSTPETAGLIGAEEFQLMKERARFINVARGSLVDEVALIDSLRSGHLAGAYLDVFGTEPLPKESPLWDMPNVLITSHSAGSSLNRDERVTALFLENLRRYLGELPLKNLFRQDRGY